MIDSVSFCLIDLDSQLRQNTKCIDSIIAQKVPDFEILVFGEGEGDKNSNYFFDSDLASKNEINKIRNFLIANSQKDYVVLMNGNILLDSNWYKAIQETNCFDMIGTSLKSSDGKRAMDWSYSLQKGPNRFIFPLEYTEWSTRAFLCGDLMVLRKSAWKIIKFNEFLSGLEGVIDFSLRSIKAGFRLGVVPEAKALLRGEPLDLGNSKSHFQYEESKRLIEECRNNKLHAESLFKLGDYKNAIDYFEKALKIDPHCGTTLDHLGWSNYFLRKYAEAMKAFSDSINLDANNDYALLGRGWTFLQMGKFSDSLNNFNLTLEKIKPSNFAVEVEALRGIAWSHYHKEDFDNAISRFEEILKKISEDDKDVHRDAYRGLELSHSRRKEVGSLPSILFAESLGGGMFKYPLLRKMTGIRLYNWIRRFRQFLFSLKWLPGGKGNDKSLKTVGFSMKEIRWVEEPLNLEQFNGYNIVKYKAHFYGVPQSLGSLDLKDEKNHNRSGMFSACTLKEVHMMIQKNGVVRYPLIREVVGWRAYNFLKKILMVGNGGRQI